MISIFKFIYSNQFQRSDSFFRIVLAFAIIGWIWLPEFSLWYVQPITPSAETIERFRTVPEQSILDELGQIDLKPAGSIAPRDKVVGLAENITKGILNIPGFPEVEISPVFSPNDLQKYPQLLIASLVAVDQLLDAYRITGREEFFRLAKESLLSFAQFESSRMLDFAMLWNDHSIGARISVLIKFWAQYRQRTDFDSAVAQTVLSLVARSGLLLAKPEHYSWRTGHGILADLALMQISTAFPFLEESDYFREVAIRRFSSHLPYYVNREGVTLLHSAGYNYGGVQFLAAMMRLYTLNDLPIPADWWERYLKVSNFYAQLRRPDGTLPMFGDTTSAVDLFGPPRTYPQEAGGAAPLKRTTDWPHPGGMGIYPEAGYAVWWYPYKSNASDALSQTVATWSYYPGLGHKLADELSVLTWAEGRNWIAGIGYWPYGFKGRLQAESWGGSNAPHLRAETASSNRSSRLIRTGSDEEVYFIEMERRGPDGFKVRREVMQIGARTWVVLDRMRDDTSRETETFWTFYPDLSVMPSQPAGSFTVSAPYSTQVMHCFFQTDQGGQVAQLSGSWEPFTGWVVLGQTPTPASTIAVNTGSERGWQLAVFSIRDRAQDQDAHSGDLMATLSDVEEDHWSISVSGIEGNSEMAIVRDQDHITILRDDVVSSKRTLNLVNVPDPQNEIEPVLTAIKVSAENSVRQVPLIPYRLEATYVLLALLVAQEILFFALRRRRMPRLNASLRAVSIIAWISVGMWLTEFHFVAGR